MGKRHELLQFFVYAHLPAHLQPISKPFGEVAEALAAMTIDQLEAEADLVERSQAASILSGLTGNIDSATPPNIEATMAVVKIGEAARHLMTQAACGSARSSLDFVLRRLLEAKDCAVRALIFKHETISPQPPAAPPDTAGHELDQPAPLPAAKP